MIFIAYFGIYFKTLYTFRLIFSYTYLMKTVEEDKLEQLLQIVQDKPGQRIVHFSDGSHILTKHLSEFCKTHESDYYLNCTKDACYDKSITKYKGQTHIKVSNFNLRRPRYKMQAIEYDYLIASLDFTQEDKRKFLEKCYPIIRTGGNIIIFIPNSSYAQRDEWRDLLTEQYYVSTNIIDDLFEHYDVIISKRMHGWGA